MPCWHKIILHYSPVALPARLPGWKSPGCTCLARLPGWDRPAAARLLAPTQQLVREHGPQHIVFLLNNAESAFSKNHGF